MGVKTYPLGPRPATCRCTDNYSCGHQGAPVYFFTPSKQAMGV
jgi:hypothetical protein